MLQLRPLLRDAPEVVELYLRRLGLDAAARDRARGAAGVRLLVTGARRRLAELPTGEGLPRVLLGDPDRASGAGLLSGARDDFARLAAALRARGPDEVELSQALETALSRADGPPAPMAIGRRRFVWGERTYVMGVVNVTPDSFSDGGRYRDPEAAVAAGERLAADGADLIDIGGESTRPGADPVSPERELERVLPVIERLSKRVDVPISIDTTKAAVARAAVQAGASLVNDISGFRFDPHMAPTLAELKVAACAMHIQGQPRTMQENPRYFDVVGEVLEHLQGSIDLATRCGVDPERLLVDPGIGFGKTVGHNLFLLRNLAQLHALGRPVLVGASRKGFIGKVTGRTVGERLPGSLAVLASAVAAGAHVIRVHDVSESRSAAQVIDAIARAREGGLAFEQP